MNSRDQNICESCRQKSERVLTSRGGQGRKLTVSFQNHVKKLKEPRNLDSPNMNIYQFMKSHRTYYKFNQEEIIPETPQPIESRLNTNNTKHRTDHLDLFSHKSDESTARIEFAAPQPVFRAQMAQSNKSSAFYKMKLMRQISRERIKPKSMKIDLGPIFSQVSKYVSVKRPDTVFTLHSRGRQQQSTGEYEEFIRPQLTSSKSEFLLKAPVSPKLAEVKQLYKNMNI